MSYLSQIEPVCRISLTIWQILTKLPWIEHEDMMNSWLSLTDLDLIFKVTVQHIN